MNTAKKVPQAEHGVLDLNREVLNELQALIKVLADRVNRPENEQKAVLVARLVEDISAEEWLTLSQKHHLRSWLGLPLDEDAAKAVSALTDTLNKLVFQRDHDPLTNLANRRYLDRFLKTEIERAERTGGSLSIIMLDLDHFKRINDTYGHLCGDKVLQKMGTFLSRSQRSYDLAARYGGEEFVIVLPGVSFLRAKNTAERLLAKFSEVEFKCDAHEPFHMTFSGGVTGISPKIGYKFKPEDLLKMADEALYEAKHAGRNRIEVSESAVETVIDTMVMAEEKQFLFKNPE